MAGGGGGDAKGTRNSAGRSILGARARVTKRIGNGFAPFSNSNKENAGDALEDVVSGGNKGNLTASADDGDRSHQDRTEERVDEEEDVEEIKRDDDFQGWLAQQKAGWRRHREKRRLKRRSEARSDVSVRLRVRWCFTCQLACAAYCNFVLLREMNSPRTIWSVRMVFRSDKRWGNN